MSKQQYRVAWEIDVEADSPREAAQQAREDQTREGTEAVVFMVTDEGGTATQVDLLETEYLSADGYPVTEGARFWDNNLRVVQVIQVATWHNTYADTGETQTWHNTTGGGTDTLSGSMQPYGRLARYDPFTGKDAEQYEAGTNLKDVKS